MQNLLNEMTFIPMEELQEETAMLYDKIMHHALYFFLSVASLAGITFQLC